MNPIKTFLNRSRAEELPPVEEIEQFGADGEEAVCRLLRSHCDTVIRNAVVPHKDLFWEKDLLVIHRGVPFILEIKNWKGEIGRNGDKFYQKKENGVYKELKSPVDTTNRFLQIMKQFYQISRPVWGVVVFAEPDCRLKLESEIDGVALLTSQKLISFIEKKCREDKKQKLPPFTEGDRILRCTRFYSDNSEFCKGILADNYLECTASDGSLVRLDTLHLRYLSVQPQPMRLRDKLYVTYTNGATDVFYNRDITLTVACLDGSYKKLAMNRLRHIVF